MRRTLIGPPRRLDDRGLFHRVSLVAVLAWVGLGADGLSSSAYGPEEAFKALGEHRYLAVALAVLMCATVLLISAAYSRIIARFPHGGGGYVVATSLLGEKAGLVSGSALLVDYVLTVTISIAAAGDAIFSILPPGLVAWKLPVEFVMLGGLMLLNIRGLRESIMLLAPVFFAFVITHAVLIGGGLLGHIPQIPRTASEVVSGFREGWSSLGLFGLLALLFRAFSLGGGTYTGIEAVSNGVPMMRQPQAQTARRTMTYMAASLAVTATGLLVLYLLWDIRPIAGKTMNAVLVEQLSSDWPFGSVFAWITMLSAGALLIVAAQAGFADGPRVLSNMALDSWVPRRFAALSDRLTTQNGIMLIGIAALAALAYTRGDVAHLVVMYSINVFLTFSLSLGGMLVDALRSARRRIGDLLLFGSGLALCLTILCVTTFEKFGSGGWITLTITGSVVCVCTLIRRHYRAVGRALDREFKALESLPTPASHAAPPEPARDAPTAVVLVGGYNGFGIHTTFNVFRAFPNHFKGLVFASVGVIDTGRFKGAESVELLRGETLAMLRRYLALAARLGIPATARQSLGTDTIDQATHLCESIAREFPNATFFTGQVVFPRETWLTRLLHNQTAFAIQRRLQWAGLNCVILPARVR